MIRHFLHSARAMFPAFLVRTGGSVAIMMALLLPVIAGGSLFAVDYTQAALKEISLQNAADTAALSATRELRFLATNERSDRPSHQLLHAIADSIAQEMLGEPGDTLSTTVENTRDERVRVDLELKVATMFGALTGTGDRTLTATAVAEIYGAQDICMVLLETSRNRAGIIMDDSARIAATDCGLHSNSADGDSIKATGSAYMDLDYICAVGGVEGSDSRFKAKGFTDCPVIEDPFLSRPVPRAITNGATGVCFDNLPSEGILIDTATVKTIKPGKFAYVSQILSTGTHTLEPGIYCGGLVIEGDANVVMNSGEYIFNGGPLIVRGDAMLKGEYVGLFFDDSYSYFVFQDNAEIELGAPRVGSMAGILVRTGFKCTHAPYCLEERPFEISSAKVRSLLGTIYLPDDKLIIDTTMPVSDEAAFTIIVAKRMHLRQSPTLVLNTNYAATDVPRPGKLKDVNPKIRLKH